MKLVYISPLRYPSSRAGSIFSMKSCEEFANQHMDVELWIPLRHSVPPDTDLFTHFNVKENFKIRRFFTLDLTKFFPSSYFILYYSFAFSVLFYSAYLYLSGRIKNYFFYSHEQFAIFLLTFVSHKTFYELHDFPGTQKIYQLLFARINGVISTNKWKAEQLSKRFNFPKSKILVVPNAVDLETFSANISKSYAREKLGLLQDDYLFGYVGTLKTMGMEKGVDTAIESLKFLPHNFKLYVVGGDSADDLQYYRNFAGIHGLADRVIFAGLVAHKEVPLHISACDALVAPFPKNNHYSYYMSPMKIFEYMASKKPIIATDLPSIREILTDGETALIVPPSDPKTLSQAVQRVIQKDVDFGAQLAERAYLEVTVKHTWKKRAERITAFLQDTL